MAGKAKNVILFLGDGMSLTTVAASRIYEGQQKGGSGEENLLSWERFPATAFSKTYNTDSQTPDSAGTMTAITTGVKTHMGAIGVSAGGVDDCAQSLDQQLQSWLDLAAAAGMGTGKTRLLANICAQLVPGGFTLIDGKGDDRAGSLVATVRDLVPLGEEYLDAIDFLLLRHRDYARRQLFIRLYDDLARRVIDDVPGGKRPF